jgi:tRNA (guanine-N7-)-methyltransferase
MEQKYIRSFGRVKGHKLSGRQESLIGDFLPKIKPDLEKISSQIWFEIGFGAGEHIIQLIEERNNSSISIIGCEPYINGSVKVVNYICENSIENIYIYSGDARDLIEKLPDKSTERLFILFPDPWPKKRHYKRRIVSKSTIELCNSKLTDNGIITIATDHSGYSDWISEIVKDSNYSYKLLETTEDCKKSGVLTRYCSKALAIGCTINLFEIYKR